MQLRSGMTLVEVLVALTLGAAITATGYGIWHESLSARERARAVFEPVSKAATVRATLRNWISAAHIEASDSITEFYGVDATGASGLDVLTFFAMVARPITAGATRISILIDTDTLTREQGLIAQAQHANGEPKRIELLKDATALNIEYLGTIEGERSWWPSWRSAVRLPEAVRLTLSVADSVRTINAIPLIVLLAETQ